MRVGGPVGRFVAAGSEDELLDVIRGADSSGEPVLVFGGGSNLVVGDRGWDGVAVKITTLGAQIDDTLVRAAAGVEWDFLVSATVDAGLAGLEPLSGIPGSVGGTPVQNVGAFGTLTSDVLDSVRVYDRATGAVESWGPERCGFGSHRQSTFKHTDRYVVLEVSYRLRRSQQSVPLKFDRLVAALGIDAGATADIREVRAAVLRLRREKGSIYDPADTDTWGVGSFFINPVLETVPEAAAASPTYPDPLGTKLPAGWLIDKAGFPPGYGAEWGRGTVALSSKHALAVCNRGNATTTDVMSFASHIRAGVQERFDIRLRPECHLVNCSLDEPVERAFAR
ncbi:MAG: UDP-N-acetylmuramate dehydrogenase [Actinobacteria bacterium]|nr:UDP-N-acetylmuramate dehydrogenase [Actinomycetota bacterium]